jgi:uncharacterized repeat protein (TIGR01451 family)
VKKLATPSGPLTCDDTVSYELKLTNLGVRDLEHLTISDTIQTGVSTAIQSLPDGCQYNHETITCDVPSLPLGQTESLTYSITISPSISVGSRLFLQTPQVDEPKDAFAQQDRSAGILEPSGIADLSLEKSGIASLAVAGREFTYTLLINNLGPTTADNVVVVDNLPNGVAFRRASPSPSITGTNSLTWSLGSILDDESREIQFVVEVASSSSGALINTASVSSSDSDPNPDNNQHAVWTYIVQEADLSIDKADYPDPVIAGEVLTYTLAITNAGPSDAHDVCVEDLLPSDDLVVITTTPGRSEKRHHYSDNYQLPKRRHNTKHSCIGQRY